MPQLTLFRGVCLLTLATCALAQDNPADANISTITQRLLELVQQDRESRSGSDATRGLIRAVAAQRANQLRKLLHRDPAELLKVALPEEVAVEISAAYPEIAANLEVPGNFEGEAETLVADNFDAGTHQTIYKLHKNGRTTEMRFGKGLEPDIPCSASVKVRGVLFDGIIAADDAALTTIIGSTSETSSAPLCATKGEQRIAILMVNFPGVTQPSTSLTTIHNNFVGATAPTFNTYVRDASGNQAWVTADLYGWFTVDRIYTCAEYELMRAAAFAAADSTINFTKYNRIYIIFPAQGTCSWSGMANIGCRSQSSADGAFSASTTWLQLAYSTGTYGIQTIAHEGGHNFGFGHSQSRDFGAAALGGMGVVGTLSEYGSKFSALGYFNYGHYDIAQKIRAAWLKTTTNVNIVETSGTHIIEPLGNSPGGLQGLKVRRGTGNNAWLWISYRQPIGSFESTLRSQIYSGATIHYEDSTTGNRTQMLDFTTATATFDDPALAAGQSWKDPYSNLTITIVSATATGLTVSLDYGPIPCIRYAPTASLTSLSNARAGTNVNQTFRVTNNDSLGCTASAFSVTSTAPTGWPTTLSTTSLTVAPGATASATLTRSIPDTVVKGSYSSNATANDGARSKVATATITAK